MSEYLKKLYQDIEFNIKNKFNNELYENLSNEGYYYLPQDVYKTYKNIDNIKLDYKEKINQLKTSLNEDFENKKKEINQILDIYKDKSFQKLDKICDNFITKSEKFVNIIDNISSYIAETIRNNIYFENDKLDNYNNIDNEINITDYNLNKLEIYHENLLIISEKFKEEKIIEINESINYLSDNYKSLIDEEKFNYLFNDIKVSLDDKVSSDLYLKYIKNLDYFWKLKYNDFENFKSVVKITQSNQTLLESCIDTDKINIEFFKQKNINVKSSINCSWVIEDKTWVLGLDNGLLLSLNIIEGLDKLKINKTINLDSPIKLIRKIKNNDDKYKLGVLTELPNNMIVLFESESNDLVKIKHFSTNYFINNLLFLNEEIIILSTLSGYIKLLNLDTEETCFEISGLKELDLISLSYKNKYLLSVNQKNKINIYTIKNENNLKLKIKFEDKSEINNCMFLRKNDQFYFLQSNFSIKIYNVNKTEFLNEILNDYKIENIFVLYSVENKKKLLFFITDKDEFKNNFKYANIYDKEFLTISSNKNIKFDELKGFPKFQILSIKEKSYFTFFTYCYNKDYISLYLWKFNY